MLTSLYTLQYLNVKLGGPGRGGTLGISGWGCAAGTLEPLTYIPELVQLNFATLYWSKLPKSPLS